MRRKCQDEDGGRARSKTAPTLTSTFLQAAAGTKTVFSIKQYPLLRVQGGHRPGAGSRGRIGPCSVTLRNIAVNSMNQKTSPPAGKANCRSGGRRRMLLRGIHARSAELLFQFLVFFMGDQGVVVRALQLHHIGPAAVGGDIADALEIDDVAFMAAEENAGVQPGLQIG